ncbi:hypothetical protein D3C81_1779720 [compost metagenome]
MGDQLQQVPHRINHQPACQAGLLGILPWHHQRPACFACRQCRGQHALHRAQLARQCQFAQAFDLGKGGRWYLAIGGEDTQGNGQVIAPAILGQVGGGEVLGDAPLRVVQTGVDDGAAYPVLALFDRGFWQTDQSEMGQAVGQVGFDADRRCLHAHLGAAVDEG